MIQFPNIANCTVFPLPEGTALEFKASFLSCTHEKIIATLCGFLNSGGGHLVIGVADDTREIIGINENKTMDEFLLKLDSIHHQHLLKKADGSTIPIGTIKVETVEAANNKKVLVVTANADPDEKYTLKDGTIWYRLSGSNYKQTTLPTVYSEEELATKLASQKALLEKKFELEQNKLQSEKNNIKQRFKKLECDFQQIVQAAKKTDCDLQQAVHAVKQTEYNLQQVVHAAKQNEYNLQKAIILAQYNNTMHHEFRDMLYTTIQLKKAEAEHRLAQEKANNSWFSSIMCCFYVYQNNL